MANGDVYYVVIHFHHPMLGSFARAWESIGSYERGCKFYRELRAKHEKGELFDNGLNYAQIVDNHVRREAPTHCPVVYTY